MNLSRASLIYYALPAFSLAMLGLPLYIYLPTFYTQYIGLTTLEVGIALFAARGLDLLFDPIIGSLSDRFKKRKLVMLVGVITLLVGFVALSYPVASWIWLLGFSFVAYSGWSLISIPYFALSAELSHHHIDTTRLASAREIITIIGLVTALILPYLFDIAEDAEATIRLMLMIVALTLPVLFIIFFKKIEEPQYYKQSVSFKEGLILIWQEKRHIRLLFVAFFANSLANALPATLFLFFVSFVLKTPEQTGMFLLLYFISGLLALPGWLFLVKMWGKKRVWMLSMLSASIAFSFVPSLGAGDTIYFAVITLVSGLSLGADMALPAAIQADEAQRFERKGDAITGVLFGFWAMLTKLSLAFAVGISFGALGLVGFEPTVPAEDSLVILSLLYGLCPVMFKFIALVVMYQYDERF